MNPDKNNRIAKEQLPEIGRDLLGENPSRWRLANSFLHVLNLSSKNMKLYAPILAGRSGVGYALLHLAKGIANVAASFAFIGPKFFGDKIPGSSDVLFISHLNNPAAYGAVEDQYYGPMPDVIAAQGSVVSVLMLNQCRARASDLSPISGTTTVHRIICAPYLRPWTEGLNFLCLCIAGIKVVALAARHNSGMVRRLSLFFGLTNASARSLVGARTHIQMEEIIRHLNPKTVIFTYEGHPWERLLCQFVHEEHPEINVIGYQHSVLLNGPAAVLQKFSKSLMPDRILTTGSATARRFANSKSIDADSIIIVGSNKAQQAEADFIRNAEKTILVVPEGTPEETKLMALFAIKLAGELTRSHIETKIALRLHPLLNFDWLKRELPKSISPPANLIFSTASLDDDAMQAGWIIYRGSTTVFSALPHGGRPLYLDIDDNAETNDPLVDFGNYPRSVSSTDDVVMTIRADISDKAGISNSGDADEAAQRDLLTKLDNYFSTLDEQIFANSVSIENPPDGVGQNK